MKIKSSLGNKIFDIMNILVMLMFCLTIIYPFWEQIILSFSKPADASKLGLHLFTIDGTFDAYRRIFYGGTIFSAYFWTILRTVIGTVLTVSVSSMLAYPLSKKHLWGRKFWMWAVAFTMFFSGGLVPTYLLVRSLHMTNTIWALIFPGLASAWNIIIIRNFFTSIPDELEESASMDGANDIFIFFRIILPVSAPIIATVTLWTMVGHWNAWFDAMIYITNGKIQVLQNLLRQVLNEASQMTGVDDPSLQLEAQEYTPESVKAAILMTVTVPILCVYPFLQKYFVKGIMVGAVKG